MTIIIGAGNACRGDDGAGLAVARKLRKRLRGLAQVIEWNGEGSGMLRAWQGVETAVIVDAVRSGAPAGMVHRYVAHKRPLPVQYLRCGSSHTFGVAEAIEVARVIGQLPRRVVVYTIEGVRFSVGSGVSAAVRRAIAAVADAVEREVRRA